ncbi:MAG: sensor histidine kinase [Erythrobacter sp.]|nr:sensor histidine kinase [Erythrobacter sp.]NCQ62636.1 sensor histidine kinase [Alphaproteobacteria bacterium]
MRDFVAPHTGSLTWRMIAISALWIVVLLLGGGIALDRTMTSLVVRNFDTQLNNNLTALIASAEIQPGGEVWLIRPMGDQRFLEPNSGLYWQISGDGGQEVVPSRSLWDQTLELKSSGKDEVLFYDSRQFQGEPLRVAQRDAILPGSETRWTFAVASSRNEIDAQIDQVRRILVISFVILGLGLMVLVVLQSYVGLRPLRRIETAIQHIRTSGSNRVTDPLPLEVQPLVQELNMLLEHSERQAEEARTHAGNLAHALKTPLTVVNNAATAHAPDLADTVIREARTMRRHVDHHLARARAVGRRAVGHAQTPVRESAEAVRRAVERLYPEVRFDIDGSKEAKVSIERQDLDEIIGNLIENAAKYGGGSVFVTIDAEPEDRCCVLWIEDDGMGIPEEKRVEIFDRGARLDTGKPGTGLGLAIVRDVAEIYGGTVDLAESEDLGGLLVRLSLPRA